MQSRKHNASKFSSYGKHSKGTAINVQINNVEDNSQRSGGMADSLGDGSLFDRDEDATDINISQSLGLPQGGKNNSYKIPKSTPSPNKDLSASAHSKRSVMSKKKDKTNPIDRHLGQTFMDNLGQTREDLDDVESLNDARDNIRL